MAKNHRLELYTEPIKISTLVMTGIAAWSLSMVAKNLAGDLVFPHMASEAIRFIGLGLLGLLFAFITRLLGNYRFNKVTFASIIEPDKKEYAFKLAVGGLLGFVVIFAAQEIVLIGFGTIFQVTAGDVYSFFIFAAVMEETLFRLGLMGLIQLAIVLVMTATNKNMNRLIPNIVGGVVATIISVTLFTWSHTLYLSNILYVIATAATGAILSVVYLSTKHTLAGMIAHMILNALAAGQLVQAMGIS